METKVLKKVGVISIGKLMGIFAFIAMWFAGIAAIIVAKTAIPPSLLGTELNDAINGLDPSIGIGSYIITIIFSSIIALILGFVYGAICALIYNVLAEFVGGVEIELE